MPVSQNFSYPISTRALGRWAENNLEIVEEVEDSTHFAYNYEGSTCSNGGTAFSSLLHVVVEGPDLLIRKAWVEIPPDSLPSAKNMCSYESGGEGFLQSLEKQASFCNKTIEEVLRKKRPLNHAGCYCTDAMVNQKWQMVLSTIHYALKQR